MTRVVDSTRYTAWFHCPFKRYLGWEWEGRGLQPLAEKVHLTFGRAVHAALEALVQGAPINEAWERWNAEWRGPEVEPQEWAHLGYGLVRGFGDFVLPTLRSEYAVRGTELELVNPLGAIFVMEDAGASREVLWLTRVDLGVERLSDGAAFNINYKTSGRPGKLEWQNEYNVQLLMEADSLGRHLSERTMGGTILLGLNKGYERDDGLRNSIFTCYYEKQYKNGDIVTSPEYASGWNRVQVVDIEGHYEWLKEEHPGVIAAQFHWTLPIDYDAAQVAALKKDVLWVEERVAEGYFPRNYSNCRNDAGYGKECPFLPICTDPEVAAAPLESGLYQLREANHPLEATVRGWGLDKAAQSGTMVGMEDEK